MNWLVRLEPDDATQARSVLLTGSQVAVRANAGRHQAVAPLNRPLSAYIEDAMRTGAKVYVCSTAMRDRNLAPEDLIEGCEGVIGMVTMLERMVHVDTTVLTY